MIKRFHQINEVNIIKRKANDCKLELVNPVKVERKLRERND